MPATIVTLTRTYDLASGRSPRGRVLFRPSARFENETTVVTAPIVAQLDLNGAISVQLYANTDPVTTPSGTGYHVREELYGEWAGVNRADSAAAPIVNEYFIIVPHDSTSTIELASLEPVGEPPAVVHFSVREAPLSLQDPRVACNLDNSGDESAKVATAISLLPETGGHIYHPPGILRTGPIEFDRPVRWEGAGCQASEVKAKSGFTGTLMTISSDAPFSRIHDVAVTGGGSAVIGIEVKSARTQLDNLYMTGFAAGTNGSAIHLHGISSGASAHAAQVTNVRILSCAGYGIFGHGFSYDCEFTQVWIGSCGVGVRYENTNAFFNNCHFWGCTGNGVELRDGNHLFSNCYSETNGGSGFNLFNAPRCKITNCNIWKNTGAGIVGSGTSERLSVMGSNIYDNGTFGVQGTNLLHGIVMGNSFYDDTSSANSQDRPIQTSGTSDKWIIVGNTFLTSEHALGANSLVGANNVVANNVTA